MANAKCCPDSICIAPTRTEVSLQSSGAHCRAVGEAATRGHVAGQSWSVNLELICKWGFDSSTGQSQHKQGGTAEPAQDSQVFFTSLVPLQLSCCTNLVWQNRTPASAGFCRPMKLEYCRESTEIIRQWAAASIWLPGPAERWSVAAYRVSSPAVGRLKLHKTMIDVRVTAEITDTSSTQYCMICKAAPKQNTDLQGVKERPIQESHFMFGISAIYAWILFFECTVHLSY